MKNIPPAKIFSTIQGNQALQNDFIQESIFQSNHFLHIKDTQFKNYSKAGVTVEANKAAISRRKNSKPKKASSFLLFLNFREHAEIERKEAATGTNKIEKKKSYRPYLSKQKK